MKDYIQELKSLIDISSDLEKNYFLEVIDTKIALMYDPNYAVELNNEEQLRLIKGVFALINYEKATFEQVNKFLLILPKSQIISLLYLTLSNLKENAETNYDH